MYSVHAQVGKMMEASAPVGLTVRTATSLIDSPRGGDREEISDAYSARDESSDYPVCRSPLIQPRARARATESSS